jgi:hypothetical protein
MAKTSPLIIWGLILCPGAKFDPDASRYLIMYLVYKQ